MICTLSLMTSTLASGQAAPTPLQPNAVPGVPPRLIQFSNSLNDAAGSPLTDRVAVTFSIYSDQTGGVPLWQETQNIQFSQGHYSVFLGDSTPGGIPMELFASGQSRWLGVRAVLPGEQEQPRILLASVPYALKAGDADTIGGLPASAFLRAEEPVSYNMGAATSSPKSQSIVTPSSSTVTTSGGTVGTISEFQTPTDIENSPITDSSGNISIANQLTVAGASNLNGVLNAASCKPTIRPSWCSGSDIGAWVNAAVSKLGSCGEIYIPAGTYNQTVTMSIPRCVKLHGASAMSTRITWTNASGWAIVVADNNPSLDNNFSYEGAVEDLTLYGPGVANTAGAIYLGGSDGAAGSPSTNANPPIQPIADPAANFGDHFNINRVRIMRNPNVTGFNVGIQWGANAWSTTIFQSLVSFCVQAGIFFPPNIGSLNSGEDISILNSSIQNNVGIGLSLGNGNFINITAMNSSFDFNGPTASCPGGGACTWQIQNGTSGLSQNEVSLVNSYVTAGDHWLQNYGYFNITGSLFTGGANSGTLGYLIDNENLNNFTVTGGQFFNSGTGCITGSTGKFSVWFGALTTSPSCPNGGLSSPGAGVDRFGNGSFTAVYTGGTVVYSCGTSGALTVNPSSCSSPTDTGLRVK
jgi:hypothetical protein